MAAILRYNNSIAYARNVLGWAAAYATGVVPVDLPPITGPARRWATPTSTNPEGLGPGLPLNAIGLPANDPLALMPLLGPGDVASQTAGYARSEPRHRCPAPPRPLCLRRPAGAAGSLRRGCRRGCSSRPSSRSGLPVRGVLPGAARGAGSGTAACRPRRCASR